MTEHTTGDKAIRRHAGPGPINTEGVLNESQNLEITSIRHVLTLDKHLVVVVVI